MIKLKDILSEGKKIKVGQRFNANGITWEVIKVGPTSSRAKAITKNKQFDSHKIFDNKIIIKQIESVNEATDWMLKLDIGKNNPGEFKKWASPQMQRKHKIKVRGGGKKWIIVGDEKKGSSMDWIKGLLDKAWRINKIKTQQIESVNEANVIQKIDKLAKRNKYGTVDGTQMNGKTAREIMAIFKHPKMNSYRNQMLKMKVDDLVDLSWKLAKPLKIKVESINERTDRFGHAIESALRELK